MYKVCNWNYSNHLLLFNVTVYCFHLKNNSFLYMYTWNVPQNKVMYWTHTISVAALNNLQEIHLVQWPAVILTFKVWTKGHVVQLRWLNVLNYFEIQGCITKLWTRHKLYQHKKTNTHIDRANTICPSPIFMTGNIKLVLTLLILNWY